MSNIPEYIAEVSFDDATGLVSEIVVYMPPQYFRREFTKVDKRAWYACIGDTLDSLGNTSDHAFSIKAFPLNSDNLAISC